MCFSYLCCFQADQVNIGIFIFEMFNNFLVTVQLHQCSFCALSASCAKELQNHVETAHEGFKMNLSELSVDVKILKVDEDTAGNNFKIYHCKLCSYSAIQANSLEWHISRVHKNMKPHQC